MGDTTARIGEGLTFEKVWAMFQETDKKFQETDKKIEKTEKLVKRVTKKMGDNDNRLGKIVESMVVPNLIKRFQELGFEFTKASPNAHIKDKKNGIEVETDAFLENGDKVMIVEIKTKPEIEHIDDHIERMKELRRYADLRNDKRAYLGAIAGLVFSDDVREYALKQGFYVVVPSGKTFAITEPSGKYKPREW